MMKMKTILTLSMILVLAAGCSSNKTSSASTPVDTTTTTTTPVDTAEPGGSGTDNTLTDSSGDTVTFTPVSLSRFNSYVGITPLNSPKDFKITVNLEQDGDLKYYGSVQISYTDNNQTHIGTFEAGSGDNVYIKNGYDNNVAEAFYNYWYNNGSKAVFSGFFQDALGSIVLVIDNSVNQGDGQGSGYVSGAVYFKNFPQVNITINPQTGLSNDQSANRKCWFIYDGPYNCRASNIIKKASLVPSESEGYYKLGTFSGLSASKSFRSVSN